MSFPELKERHAAATATVNSLRERLKQRRQQLLDTDVANYTRTQGRTAVNFSSTDLVCCRTLQGHTGKVYSLDWTSERNRIVSASQDGRLIIWNALTSQKTHAIKLPCAWVMTCAFAPNGHSISCGGLDSACSIFNLNSQVDRDGNIPVSQVLMGHKGYVSSCQYFPDRESHLVTSSGDQTCVLWDVTTGQRISIFGGEFPSGHTSDVLSVSVSSSNSNMFVSGSCDATARLWDARIASRAIRTYNGHQGDVNTVKFFPDGQRFGTGSDDGMCRLFDMRTGHLLQVYAQQHNNNEPDFPMVTSIAFSISGRLLFAGYSNGDCYVWDTLLAEVVLNLGKLQSSHEGRISCLGLSDDGSALCTGSWDKNLKVASGGIDRCIENYISGDSNVAAQSKLKNVSVGDIIGLLMELLQKVELHPRIQKQKYITFLLVDFIGKFGLIVFVEKVELIRPNEEMFFLEDAIGNIVAWVSMFIVLSD